jgi:hypothetical protein
VQNQTTVFHCLSQQIKISLDLNATVCNPTSLMDGKKNMQVADDVENEGEESQPAQRNQSARRPSKRCVPLVSSVVWDGGWILQHGTSIVVSNAQT